ncbi:MAG: hypothetical protein EZS28_019238, partial [Streblomastix strix]
MQTKSNSFSTSGSIVNSLETMIVTALERGNGQDVRKEIENSNEQRRAEIATIYRVHFDDFIDQELQVFELSEGTEMLRTGIGPVARELRDYGQDLLKKNHLRALRNVDATLLILNQLLALLGEYQRLFQFLEQKRYFESMRCVQRLKQSHLPNLRKVFPIIGA